MPIFKKSFPFYEQLDSQDCSFACLKMISKYYGVEISNSNPIFTESNLLKQGISLAELNNVAKTIGYETIPVKLDYQKAISNVSLPSIFFWNQNHFIVVYKIKNNKIYVADPSFGKTVYKKEEFLKGWTQNNHEGFILLLRPTKKLYENTTANKSKKNSFQYITKYLKQHKVQLFLIALTLLISSSIEFIFPFFTQKIIDKGVVLKNVKFIYLVLIAQLVLFISRTGLEFYRSWLFIHISSRISLSIISDFLIKLMRLPLKFFNSKNIGDITQRIHDHKRIETFLSKDLVQTLFAFLSLLIYASILISFNLTIFFIILVSHIVVLLWIFRFLEKIKIADQKAFALNSRDQNKIYELITAMQEIKLNNLEEKKRDEWQKIQNSIYRNNINQLKIKQQYESYRFIDFLQSILVVFVAALAVMNNAMTIGTMLSIMYIIGGINGPITQLINFVLDYQLVKVSFERLNEIHNKPNEENISKHVNIDSIEDINIEKLHFSYNTSSYVLTDISLQIPKGKTTAIVGVSGSGKTTLLKLLLKFYKPQKGNISLANKPLEEIDNITWRNKCGVILQDSFIFSDTIAYNITLEETPSQERLTKAIQLANITDFIEKLPLKLTTIIGTEGIGISQGQKQRILIARAIYKNPDYLFFDEATNSLDATNEKIIVENINNYFAGKTMIIVAHRLSTVKNADQIIVIDNGTIIEQGNHNELIKLKGKYFKLIQNQLELGL